MSEDAGVLVRSIPDAVWLPRGGRADIVRSSFAPRPTSLVRLLLRRGAFVFCIPRSDSGKLDLPTRRAGPTDVDGQEAARDLAQHVLGEAADPVPVGFVRNVVSTSARDYKWPTPLAHFVVWTADGIPAVPGQWIDTTSSSELAERHWFPLLR